MIALAVLCLLSQQPDIGLVTPRQLADAVTRLADKIDETHALARTRQQNIQATSTRAVWLEALTFGTALLGVVSALLAKKHAQNAEVSANLAAGILPSKSTTGDI